MFNLIRRAVTGPVGAVELEHGLRMLGFDGTKEVIVHSSLSSFGVLAGGTSTMLEVLLKLTSTVVMPAFTYYTLQWPRDRVMADWPKPLPVNGSAFRADSPVSSDIGRVPQALLESPGTLRSNHPALSFIAHGSRAGEILAVQHNAHPYAPIGALYALDGEVLLLGVDHRSNTTVHYGEHIAGRPLLERYALGPEGGVQTTFPNCSAGFNAISPHLRSFEQVRIGCATVSRMRVRDVVDTTIQMLERNPQALLCRYEACRCQAVRARVRTEGLTPRDDPWKDGALVHH